MHHEYISRSVAEKLFIIGICGSKNESPEFMRCFEKRFEEMPLRNHTLGIERHLYHQNMKDSVSDIPSVKAALNEFI